eukprot:scaffold2038_cov85-Skeletonema_marinoi.AAC.1
MMLSTISCLHLAIRQGRRTGQHNMKRPNRLNIYSVKGGRPSSYSRRCIIAAACLIVVIILLSKRILQHPSTSSSSEIHESKCWLKQAINSGECQLFSHRSYYNAQTDDCRSALEQLKSIGVNHLDLDLSQRTTITKKQIVLLWLIQWSTKNNQNILSMWQYRIQ